MYNELLKTIELNTKYLTKEELRKLLAYFCTASFAYCAIMEFDEEGNKKPEEVLKEQNGTIAGYILTVLEHDLTTIVRGNEVRKKVFQTIFDELDKFMEVPDGLA
ncbi:hypothetical protein DXD51_02910 [Eubacterium sp. TM05-53]|nr:hypothetical protein DXD51_02910 [Eubacterium sp. TM05-53]